MSHKNATGTNANPPFVSDVDYLYAEGEHLIARVARFELQRVMTDAKEEGFGRSSARRRPAPATDGDRWAAATEAEQRARTELDRRIAATTASGKLLGLDAVVATYGLGVVERTTLLIAALHALDCQFEQAIGKISDGNFRCGPSPEVVWEFLELDPAARIASRVCFSPTAPLLKCDLIRMDIPRDGVASYLRSADVHLTDHGFALLVGLSVVGADKPTVPE